MEEEDARLFKVREGFVIKSFIVRCFITISHAGHACEAYSEGCCVEGEDDMMLVRVWWCACGINACQQSCMMVHVQKGFPGFAYIVTSCDGIHGYACLAESFKLFCCKAKHVNAWQGVVEEVSCDEEEGDFFMNGSADEFFKCFEGEASHAIVSPRAEMHVCGVKKGKTRHERGECRRL